MPGIEITRAIHDGFAGTLEPRVDAFIAALEAHSMSVGIPAPSEAPLVEAIARAGGMAAVTIIDPPAPAAPPEPDVPPPLLIAKLVVVERIGMAGKLREARAALQIGKPDDDLSDAALMLRERWEAASTIAQDDAQVRGFLAALGLDPDAILGA
ncbi:MAG: hypothetical protein K2X74_00205 [Acetobacteraceae bacterium]|nr:hypothetical protein [Acetobacteraceae bacterium]MBY0363548.1 hypothetical protein [Phreatobacter sp.]